MWALIATSAFLLYLILTHLKEDGKFQREQKTKIIFAVSSENLPSKRKNHASNSFRKTHVQKEDITSLWESFSVPVNQEVDFYSKGPGMAMVTLEDLKNTESLSTRQGYIAIQIITLCDASNNLSPFEKSQLDTVSSPYSELFREAQIYCAGYNLDDNSKENLISRALSSYSSNLDLEVYFGLRHNIPLPENIDPLNFPDTLSEYTALADDPLGLLLIVTSSGFVGGPEKYQEMHPDQKELAAAAIIAACSSYLNCDNNYISELEEYTCFMGGQSVNDNPLCNKTPSVEEIALTLSPGSDINKIYQLAYEIVLQVKETNAATILNRLEIK